jgi:phosphoribosylformylglycinamidine synthase
LEVDDSHVNEVLKQFAAQSLPVVRLGRTTTNKNVTIRTADNTVVLEDSIATLRDTWEATSFQLEKLQSNLVTVEEEQKSLATRSGPKYSLTFTPQPTSDEVMTSTKKHKVAIIREEGSNGDREMSAAFHLAGFEVWDIAMKDLIHQRVALKDFRHGLLSWKRFAA